MMHRPRSSTHQVALSGAVEPGRIAVIGSRRAETEPLIDPMPVLIALEMEARDCTDLAALKFLIVNATRRLAPYDLAVLMEFNTVTRSWRIGTSSGTTSVDRNAVVPRAIEAWINNPQQPLLQSIDKLQDLDLSAGEQSIEAADDFPFVFGLWLPVKTRSGVAAGLLALRAKPWMDAHHVLMKPLLHAYGHAWSALDVEKRSGFRRLSKLNRKALGAAAALGLAGIGFIPVSMSVLAPAEVASATADAVSAPMDGVIESIDVAPGQAVTKGAPLMRFVDTKLRNDLELALKAKAVAEAKYFKVLQSAVSTQKDMQDIAVAKAELALAEADLAYARELASRVVVLAPRDGLTVYSAKSDWVGKPVTTGERIMEIVDPGNSELRIDLHASDAIAVEEGSKVALFLDGDPLRSIEATISRISYRPVLGPDRQMVFHLVASFADGKMHRIGLRGTARVNGERVRLAYYLLRRPVSLIRQKFGF